MSEEKGDLLGAEKELSSSVDIDMSAPVHPPSASATVQLAYDTKPTVAEGIIVKRRGLDKYLNKGDISNVVTFLIMVISFVLKGFVFQESLVMDYVVAFGLFGFAGGITNWLAVKMLFDRIPFIIGSGVIPRQFKEIRETVKDTIMKSFFDPEYLESYLKERSQSLFTRLQIGDKIKSMVEKPDFEGKLCETLTELSMKPEGMMVQSIAPMFGGIPAMVTMFKPLLAALGGELGNMMTTDFDPMSFISIDMVRDEIDALMTEKLQLLTPELVKELMEEVIREHLGWLIVWGNVFGGLIGVVSLAAGYGR